MTELQIKSAVRARDDYRCTECGMTNDEHKSRYGSSLQVHRVFPGSKYAIESCVTLCRDCHVRKPKSEYKGALQPLFNGQRQALQLRLHPVLRKQLELLSAKNLTTLTTEATAAIREYLAKHGLWPPKHS